MAKQESAAAAANDNPQPAATGAREREYVVVARRYRPQTFDELVGQEHVARALSGAIATGRVGHAYLFTGARGVGKTSAARILAKCLNCVRGPAPVPCNECDSCLSIASGDDVDVLEIDGASNRGIEEMRELRHNVAIRPSRSRFKVYIIDEVHMLTREAFNALLKTLEEPPEHVKFIFCTTEAEKIPVTILSRCQRFDFAGIETRSIVERLRQIVAAEGVEAEPAALTMLSRRAGGSMRDSQSLLEQLLSLGTKKIRALDVDQLLGTASTERLVRLAGHLIARDAAAALADLDQAVAEGVDTGQLLDQLLVYFRDLMVAAVGGAAEMYLAAEEASHAAMSQAAGQLGLHTVLAIMQIIEQSIARLRYSTHGRVLAELALVRICQLADLEEIAVLVEQLKTGQTGPPAGPAAPRAGAVRTAPAAAPLSQSSVPAAPPKKKEDEPPDDVDASGRPSEAAEQPAGSLDGQALWRQALSRLSGMVGLHAARAERVAMPETGFLVATFAKTYNSCKAFCEQPEQFERLEQALAEVAGGPIRLSFALVDDGVAARPESDASPPRPAAERIRDRARHPLVSKAMELFDARPVRVDGPGQ
ncbi:MAG: DNA polymerase III subunit gamma/tau [Planctomycetia bacterium]|nr:DNA polymerase III subunit gamma/tau [Planctomycetia bacterium]